MKRFLSLGAGVQSSTLALMIAEGYVPMVDAAIFADTQWEPKHVYKYLDWLETQLPFPVYRVTKGDLRADVLRGQNSDSGRFATVPWFTVNPDGSKGMGRRQCTSEYKIHPVTREKRRLLGYQKGERIPLGACEMLIGISTDEAQRMKPSLDRWSTNVWPLIDLKMSRQDCLDWMWARGYPEPAKSSCIGCPYHNNAQWREIQADPVMWADVLEVDAAIREPAKARGLTSRQFMHAQRKPMSECDFSVKVKAKKEPDHFNNECEGMCGV